LIYEHVIKDFISRNTKRMMILKQKLRNIGIIIDIAYCNVIYCTSYFRLFFLKLPGLIIFFSFVQGLRFHRDGHASHHRHRHCPAPTLPPSVVAVVPPPNPGPNRRPTLSGCQHPRCPSTNHLHRC
jgi:hypothetical protein